MSEFITFYDDDHPIMDGPDVCGIKMRVKEEVVRCRDCIRYSLDDCGNTWCAYVASAVRPDDFCAWGERRGDAE